MHPADEWFTRPYPEPQPSGNFSVRSWRRTITAIIVGAATSVAVAWACAMWSAVRSTVNPFPHPAGVAETAGPDGEVGLQYRETGFGWSYTWLRSFGSGPYGGTFHRMAGFPFPALRSRVEVLDSQSSGRFSEGEPEPTVIPQRRRWELPVREIIYRGMATKDLPAWLHARPDRRLPLVPLALGFAGDTLIYAATYAILASGCGRARRRSRMIQRGFSVITNDAS